jgi:hypothetical protein
MKKTSFSVYRAISFGIFSLILLVVMGCPNDSTEDIWLKDIKNPFVGEWKSDAASDGTRLTFIGSSNGTFQYRMEGVPQEMGLPENGNGGYIIKDNIIISYFYFGLIKSNIFEVVDNDTITMTEFVLNEAGKKETGEATDFRRVGEISTKENQAIILPNNIFIGKKWSADIPEPEVPDYFYESTWEFKNDGTVICTFLGLGEALGFDSEDAPYTFGYVIFGDKLVLFTESAEGNEIKVSQFSQQNASTINTTEMVVANNFVTQAGDVAMLYTLLE